MHHPFTRRPRPLFVGLALIVGLLLVIPAAYAAKVYLNGVEISSTNISSRQLDDVQRVLIDHNGDVHIVAPGYDIRVENAAPGAPPRDPAAMTYILGEPYIALFVNDSAGSVPYDFTLKINGVVVEKFPSDRRTSAVDISGYIKLGDNEIQIVAEKVGSRRGRGSDASMRLALGPGSNEGGRATVRRIRASLEVKAGESERRIVTEETFKVEARNDEN